MQVVLRTILAFIIFLNAAPAAAASNDPAAALRAFLTSVDQKDYAAAWSDFTRSTQDAIVKSVANNEHMDAAQVHSLFDANDSRIDAGFWDSFRKSSTAGALAQYGMTSDVFGNGANAEVRILTGGRTVTIKMFLEVGAWKVGWMETFFPNSK
jgi:hypothetical protein